MVSTKKCTLNIKYNWIKTKRIRKDAILTLIKKIWDDYINIRQSICQGNGYFQDKEYCFIMIKGSIHQKHITILNIYAPDSTPSKHMKQKLIELWG